MSQVSREGIRVVLDLATFFQGKRKKCYYFIDLTKNRFVRDVCEDVKSRFGIRNSISLEVNGCYVPKKEDIRVLFNEDVIKVIDAKKSKDNLNSWDLNGENIRHEDFDDVISFVPDVCNGMKLKRPVLNDGIGNDEMTSVSEPKKKRKSEIVNLMDGTDNNTESVKESKKCVKNKTRTSKLGDVKLETFAEIEGRPEPSNISDNNATLITTSKADIDKSTSNLEEKTAMKKVKDFDVGGNLEIPSVQTCLDPGTSETIPKYIRPCQENHRNNLETTKGESSQDCSKTPIEFKGRKKRLRRKRKRTPNLKDLSFEENCFAESFPVTSFVDSTVKKAVHIKFSDNDENDQSQTHGSYSNISDENNRINSHIRSQQPGESSTNLENSKGLNYQNIDESKHSSIIGFPIVLTDNNGFISNNIIPTPITTPVIFECKKINKSANNEPEKIEIDQKFLKYPLLKTSPKINDILAFKKWKMDANYCPGVSGFIVAKVLQVSENEESVKLKILNGHSEFEEPLGKFTLLEEDEDNEKGENEKSEQSKQNEISDIEMKVSDLLETRIMFP